MQSRPKLPQNKSPSDDNTCPLEIKPIKYYPRVLRASELKKGARSELKVKYQSKSAQIFKCEIGPTKAVQNQPFLLHRCRSVQILVKENTALPILRQSVKRITQHYNSVKYISIDFWEPVKVPSRKKAIDSQEPPFLKLIKQEARMNNDVDLFLKYY